MKEGEGEGLQEDRFDDKKIKRFFSFWSKDEFKNVIETAGYELVEYTHKPPIGNTKENWHCFFVGTK